MYGVFKCVGAFTHNVFLIMILAPTTPTSRMRWNYPSLSNGKGSVMIERQEGEEETTFVIREGNFCTVCLVTNSPSFFPTLLPLSLSLFSSPAQRPYHYTCTCVYSYLLFFR